MKEYIIITQYGEKHELNLSLTPNVIDESDSTKS